jgi:hypothetical protein
MMRTGIGAAIAACWVVTVLPSPASSQIVLGDALSRINLFCNSAQGPNGNFAEPVSLSCEEHPTVQSQVGTTRALATTSFDGLLLASTSTECVACPFGRRRSETAGSRSNSW